MSEQLTFIAPPMPPPAMVVRKEIDAARKRDESAAFERFWSAFPYRLNNPKQPARVAWARALRGSDRRRPATIAEIMDGLARYQFSPDPTYRPMASTWLNQSRWSCENEDLNGDAYGLKTFLAALPHATGMSAACYEIGDLKPILIATGWDPSWRGSFDALEGWLRDGYIPDSIARVVATAVAEFGSRATLAAFDKRVRFRAERIVR